MFERDSEIYHVAVGALGAICFAGSVAAMWKIYSLSKKQNESDFPNTSWGLDDRKISYPIVLNGIEESGRTVDLSKNNVLMIFHGNSHFQYCKPAGLDTTDCEFYALDKNPMVQPDFLIDVSKPEELARLPDKAFNSVVIYPCNCCTSEVFMNDTYRETLFDAMRRILKDSGKLYIKDWGKIVKSYMTAQDVEKCNFASQPMPSSSAFSCFCDSE